MDHIVKPTERHFIAQVDGSVQTYLLLLPPRVETADTLVVAFHGHGAQQDQFMTADIYGDAFGKVICLLQQRNIIYAALEYRGNSWMGPLAEADTRQVLAELREEFSPRRVLLLGASMGGSSVLCYAALNPGGLDGVLAMCPATDLEEFFHQALAGPLPELAQAIQASYGGRPEDVPHQYHRRSSRRHAEQLTMPLTLVHGDADALISVSHSRTLVQRLAALGAAVRYVEIPEGDHDSPVQMAAQEVALLLDLLPIA